MTQPPEFPDGGYGFVPGGQYPATEGSTGQRNDLVTPHTVFRPVSGSGPSRRGRYPRRERTGGAIQSRGGIHSVRQRAQIVRPPRQARGSHHDGKHTAHRTAAHHAAHTAVAHHPAGEPRVHESLHQLRLRLEQSSAHHSTGRSFGAALGHTVPLGHHPQADGKPHTPSQVHNGLIKRGTILSYNSATNTATVRYGDTPDSPVANIPVSPLITATQLNAATMAGVHLWSSDDPTDALITTVQ